MKGNDRTWIIPKTTKLMSLDIAMPTVRTALPSGLVVTFKEPEQIDPEAIERYIGIYRAVCYGTKLEIWGFSCILNEILVSPLSTVEVEENREDLHNPVFPILGVFRLNGQSKRDDGMIFGSCKASQSPVYPIRDAFLAVNHASCPSLSSSGPRQWGESALKTSRPTFPISTLQGLP